MKYNHLWTAVLTLGLAIGTLQFTGTLRAQSQNQPNAQQDEQKPQIFVGKVVKMNNGQFVLLTDEQAGQGVYLDDQEKAKAFEGKKVKITGVLELAKHLVHITDIEPA